MINTSSESSSGEFTCTFIKSEPVSFSSPHKTPTKYEILDSMNRQAELTKEQEKSLQTILMSIKKESITKMDEQQQQVNIDLNLLKSEHSPATLPILLRPPSTQSLKSPPSESMAVSSVQQLQQPPLQQSIPIISITNYHHNLTDPRIDFQHKHLQNQLKKLLVILSANNQQQVKFNNSICTSEHEFLKLSYDLTDLKNQVEYNLRTSLLKFSSQMCLIDYYDLNKQLECVFADLSILQDKVCANHVFLKDLYEYINELKLNVAVKMKKFFKMQQLPELFQNILKQVHVATMTRSLGTPPPPISPMESAEVVIRDPRLRKNQQLPPLQPQQQLAVTLAPSTDVTSKKYTLNLKILRYNQSNETPKSPYSPKSRPASSNGKRVLMKQTSVSSVSSTSVDFGEQIKQICDNIHLNSDNPAKKKEKFMTDILSFIGTLLSASEESEKPAAQSHSHLTKSSHSSHSRKRNRSGSQTRHRHHNTRHHSDHRSSKRSRSRSRSHSRRRRYRSRSRSDSSSSKRSRETPSSATTTTTTSDRTSFSSISSSSPTPTPTPTPKTSTTSNTTTTSTKIGLKIVYNKQQQERTINTATTTSAKSEQHTKAPALYNIENIPLPLSPMPSQAIYQQHKQSFYI